MRSFVCLFLSLLVFVCSAQKGNKNYVVGISYLDQSPVRIEIADGKIKSVVKIKKLSGAGNKIYVAPGLFDNQINGYKGISFTDLGGELTYERILLVTKSMWENGITTYLPTLTSNEKKIILKNFALLAKVKDDPSIRGSIPGFHLEGPYISPEIGYRGAHGLKYIRKPDWNEFMEFMTPQKKEYWK